MGELALMPRNISFQLEDEDTIVYINFNGHVTYEEFMENVKSFALAIGFQPETIIDYSNDSIDYYSEGNLQDDQVSF